MLHSFVFQVFKTLGLSVILLFTGVLSIRCLDAFVTIERANAVIYQAELYLAQNNYIDSEKLNKYNNDLKAITDKSDAIGSYKITHQYNGLVKNTGDYKNAITGYDNRPDQGEIATLEIVFSMEEDVLEVDGVGEYIGADGTNTGEQDIIMYKPVVCLHKFKQ